MKEEKPNAIRVEVKTVKRDTSLPIALAQGGGFAAIITPK
jgi:hypothetical protein